MCTPEKKAHVWSTYLNSQYESLWNIANACGDRHEEKCRFYRAFATYDYSASIDSSIPDASEESYDRITFEKPELIFLCNHAVVLSLTVKDGYLTNISDDETSSLKEIPLAGVQASFRMTFTRTHVTGRDSKIDDQAADHEVRMVVFDFEKATLLTAHGGAEEAFFRTYLQFLRRAGHHVLFGFPDFTDKKVLESLPVDYAVLHRTDEELEAFCREITYFNITTHQINEYVQHVQYDKAEARAQERKEALAASIFTIRWNKGETAFFDIRFGVPVVKALCPHEVLFVFTLEEITQLDNIQLTTQDYTVAFVVNVSEFDGKTLKVDFRTARYTDSSSSIYTFETISETHGIDAESIIEYLSTEYMDILTKFNYNIIFGPPDEKPRAAQKDGGFWRRVHNVTDYLAVRRYGESAIWIDRSQHVSLSGADQAFALSERAIDDILRTKWLRENYDVWTTEAFKATFRSFSVRLLSNDHLIIVIEIEQAEVISGSAQGKQRPGRGPPLRIFQARSGHSAAELQARIDEEQRESYKGTMVFEVDLEFNELADDDQALDFELTLNHVEYIESLSDLHEYKSGLKASETAQATVRRFMQEYFTELHAQKKLIVGTVLARDNAQNFAFKIICEREVKIENFFTARAEASDSSIIVIVGLHSERPTPAFPWSPGWLPSTIAGGVGTVWIAREEFLQRLLEILETFNAQTTIVRGTDDRFVALYSRHADPISSENTPWQRESAGDLVNEYMEYNWHYSYDANRREGTMLTQNLEALLLRTQNQVWVPTESSSKTNRVVVALTGEHHTEAAQKQKHGHQLLKKDTTIWWELILTIMSSTEDGLRIVVDHETNTYIDGDDIVEDIVHADTLLNMAGIVKKLEADLRNELEGPWVYNWLDLDPKEYEFTNPIFTRSGDLVFEIYRRGATDGDTSGIPLTRENVASMVGTQGASSFVATSSATASRQAFSTTTTTTVRSVSSQQTAVQRTVR